MIDIHSHILPNIDDGSKSMAMSMEMARMYLESGISKVIATPHHVEGSYINSLEEKEYILKKFQENLVKENIDLQVFLGNEVYLSKNMLEDLENKEACSLNYSKYVLVELPMYDIPSYAKDMMDKLQSKGYVPIIPHPERNADIMKDPNVLYQYIQRGCLAQINLPSLEGDFGKEVKETGEILLKHNMIHFAGVDAHRDQVRNPEVSQALEILRSLVSEEKFEILTYVNGKNLLENKDIKISPPRKYERKKLY